MFSTDSPLPLGYQSASGTQGVRRQGLEVSCLSRDHSVEPQAELPLVRPTSTQAGCLPPAIQGHDRLDLPWSTWPKVDHEAAHLLLDNSGRQASLS